jgi:hypothetical protein
MSCELKCLGCVDGTYAYIFVCIVCMRSSQAILNRLPNLLWLRARDTLLDIPVLEDAECRHLTHAEFVRDVFAFFDVVKVELDLIWASAQHVQ